MKDHVVWAGAGGVCVPGLEEKTAYQRQRTKEATKAVPPSWVGISEDGGLSDIPVPYS